MNISKRELTSSVDSLYDFFKTIDHASKCQQIPLPKPKVEIGSTKSKTNLFFLYCKDIFEYSDWKIRLSIRFGTNKSNVYSVIEFEIYGNHFFPEEIVNFNHRETHHLNKNRYYVRNKCEIIESNYDVYCIHPWFWVCQKHYFFLWGRVLTKYEVLG